MTLLSRIAELLEQESQKDNPTARNLFSALGTRAATVRNFHRPLLSFVEKVAGWVCPTCDGNGTALGRRMPHEFNEFTKPMAETLASRPCPTCAPIREALVQLEKELET